MKRQALTMVRWCVVARRHRGEVRSWLDAQWDPQQPLGEWWSNLLSQDGDFLTSLSSGLVKVYRANLEELFGKNCNELEPSGLLALQQ